MTVTAQKTPYTNCARCWNADSLGNHRVKIEVTGNEKVVKAMIPWRRRDNHPEMKRIILQDGATNKKIANIKTGNLNREYGEIYFEPTSGKGDYSLYYMPYKNAGSANYPNSVYLSPEITASSDWLTSFEEKNSTAGAIIKKI